MAKKFRDLLAQMPKERVERIEKRAQEELAKMRLRKLRRAMNLTQEQLAQTLEITQGSLSKIERQTDMHISTLRRFLEALGGQLEISVVFREGERIIIDQFENPETNPEAKEWTLAGLRQVEPSLEEEEPSSSSAA